MPEISRFFGIIIRMYSERDGKHHLPHFHAQYQNQVASFSIDPVEILAGKLPPRQRRFVKTWAELHRDELLANWERLFHEYQIEKIDPLR